MSVCTIDSYVQDAKIKTNPQPPTASDLLPPAEPVGSVAKEEEI